MILPTKTIQPVDSLLSISALIIEILKEKELTLDDLFDEFNKRYYKKITIEKLILSVDFLYLTNKVMDNNAIIKLESQLKNFIIAENFDLLKQKADDLTAQLNDIRNKIFYLDNTLKRKEISLKDSKNEIIDNLKIEHIFNEANFFFKEMVTKRLEEAQDFHTNLINNRKKRLTTEINELKLLLIKLNTEKDNISIERDNILKDLNNSGTLEERDSIKDRIKTFKLEIINANITTPG